MISFLHIQRHSDDLTEPNATTWYRKNNNRNISCRVHGNQGNPGHWPPQFRQTRDQQQQQQQLADQQQFQQQQQQQPSQQQQQQQLHNFLNPNQHFGLPMEGHNLERSDTELTTPLTEEEFKDLELLNFEHGAR